MMSLISNFLLVDDRGHGEEVLVDRVGAAEGVVDGLLGAAHPKPDQLVLPPRPVAAVRRTVVEHCKFATL